jgi:hypothetical protein
MPNAHDLTGDGDKRHGRRHIALHDQDVSDGTHATAAPLVPLIVPLACSNSSNNCFY